MASRRALAWFFAVGLFVNAFSLPTRKFRRDLSNNKLDMGDKIVEPTSVAPVPAVPVPIANIDTVLEKTKANDELVRVPKANTGTRTNSPPTELIGEIFGMQQPAAAESKVIPVELSADRSETPDITSRNDDDDFDDDIQPASTTNGGSNLFSLLSLAGPLLSGLSGGNNIQKFIRQMFIDLIINPTPLLRRNDVGDNEIDIDYDSKPPFQRIESDEEGDSNSSADSASGESKGDGNTASEESVESGGKNSKQAQSESAASESESGSDSEEPPGGGDGQGGGVLGLLAGLSGGEDGSDLASLLSAVSGIVVNLSGDGIDVNSLIATGLGLFVGLLSEGEENPGSVVASYLITSLDTISGGGAKNNGAFFGNFISKLLKGTSAAGDGADSDEENGMNGGSDSAGFFISLIMGLLGSLSKGSSSS